MVFYLISTVEFETGFMSSLQYKRTHICHYCRNTYGNNVLPLFSGQTERRLSSVKACSSLAAL